MLRTLLVVSGLVFVLGLAACEDAGQEGVPPETAPPAAEPTTTPPAQQ